MTKEITLQILKIIGERVGRDPANLHLEMHLESDLGLDSISIATLVVQFQPLLHKSTENQKCLAKLLAAETIGEINKILLGANLEMANHE